MSKCVDCDWPRQDWMPDMPPMPICCGCPASPKFGEEIGPENTCTQYKEKQYMVRANIFEFAMLGMERPR